MESVIKIVIALFFPPLAALMQVGISAHLLINILLLVLGLIPVSQVHALWLMLERRR